MTNEMIKKAKACKTAEELLALAKENNIEMTEMEVAAKYKELHNEGELSDDELDSASGGACSGGEDTVRQKIYLNATVKINDTSKLEWGGVGASCVCCCSAFNVKNVSQRDSVTYGKLICACCAKSYAYRTEYPYDGEAFTIIT